MKIETKSVSDYIMFDHNSQSSHETYVNAQSELLEPFPSTALKDFPVFNKIIGGFRPREFTIICGATGLGKTTLCANFSKSLILSKVPHFVASVETGANDFVKRVMSAIANKDFNDGSAVNLDELNRFNREYGEYFRSNYLRLSLFENRFTVDRLMSEIAYQVHNHGCKVAMIDNLNFFLEVKRSSELIVEMDRVIHELIIFCKQVDVHLIMIMHPKKTESGRVENEFDIKGSATACQEAHNVFLLNRAGKDFIEGGYANEWDREIKIAKMRRRGMAVGKRFVIKCVNGVTYQEGVSSVVYKNLK